MSNATVLRLDQYRERRDLRLKLAASLYRTDHGRAELLDHLARLAALLGADRVATVWIDEYGPGLVHPHVVLDLLNDRPRRSFSADPLRKAWKSGVPGVLESVASSRSEGPPWTLAVALGSDGTRSWFLAADAVSARPTIDPELRDRVMFVAGECSAVVLHRDLDAMAATDADPKQTSRPRFAGWPILQDLEGREDDEAQADRIALRFIVARLPRLLVEDDLAISSDRLRQQAERAREELRAKEHEIASSDSESALWEAVLEAFEKGDLEALGAALIDLGAAAEGMTHLHGATELYATAYEICAATGHVHAAVEAARFAGRAQRRLARWDEAHRWYAVARAVAEAASLEHKVAVILDGVANIHRDRGNHPAARATLREALAHAERSGDHSAIGRVHHGFLALEHVAGNLQDAIAHGWSAIRLYTGRQDQVEGLASLAGALIDAGELSAAEDAWTIVATCAEQEYYRLFALEARAYIAALKSDAALFARRVAEVDARDWENTGPEVAQAEILYHRGLAWSALGRVPEARRWLDRAIAFAESRGFSRTVFEAENALRALGSEDVERGAPQLAAPPAETLEARSGLRELRLSLVEGAVP